jgi:hypothetical protein
MGLSRLGGCISVGLVVLLAGATGTSAQEARTAMEGFRDLPRLGIGYVVNAPNVFTGVALYGVSDIFGGLGLYVDAKFNLDKIEDESDFFPDLSVADVELAGGQDLRNDDFGWWSVNAALMRPISSELMLYAGAGYTHEDVYLRYNDPLDVLQLNTQGWYWIRDDAASGGHINLLAGAFFRMGNRVALQFGLESQPAGATVGFSYSFPLR